MNAGTRIGTHASTRFHSIAACRAWRLACAETCPVWVLGETQFVLGEKGRDPPGVFFGNRMFMPPPPHPPPPNQMNLHIWLQSGLVQLSGCLSPPPPPILHTLAGMKQFSGCAYHAPPNPPQPTPPNCTFGCRAGWAGSVGRVLLPSHRPRKVDLILHTLAGMKLFSACPPTPPPTPRTR